MHKFQNFNHLNSKTVYNWVCFNGKYIIISIIFLVVFFIPAIYFWVNGHKILGNNSFKESSYPLLDSHKPAVLGMVNIRGKTPSPAAPKLSVPKNLDFSRINAKSYLVYDVKTGQVLASKQPQLQISIASLTKLLTALVAYEELEINEIVDINDEDEMSIRPVLGLKSGDKIKIADLLASMVVGSANDAALAVANYATYKTGYQFSELMNRKAQSLDMTNSHFSNPWGFDSRKNYSTAEDVRKLIDATQKKALFSLMGKKKSFNFSSENNRQFNILATNKLIATHDDIESIKTGLTPDADGAMAVRAIKGNNSVIIIVLGSKQREEDIMLIKEEIFSKYTWGGGL